jgi:hypothetical protein
MGVCHTDKNIKGGESKRNKSGYMCFVKLEEGG